MGTMDAGVCDFLILLVRQCNFISEIIAGFCADDPTPIPP